LKRFTNDNLTKRVLLYWLFQLAAVLVITQDGLAASGKCVPVGTGIWDCDLKSFRDGAAECVSPATRDPIWQRLGSEAEAVEFLDKKYVQLGDAIALGNWMACQGFGVYGDHDRSAEDFIEHPRLGSFTASFDRKKFTPFRLNWLNPLTWTSFYDYQAFDFRFEATGKLRKIEVIQPL
jgi:hypothetical protein